MENLSFEEEDAINELKNRVKEKLTSPVLKEDESLFYRFLKARDFNVNKAEKMLLKHIEWRKVYQVDTILDTFKPKEVFLKYIEPSLIGFDKEGNIVRYTPTGRINSTDVLKCFKMNDYMRHCIWFVEKNASFLTQQAKKTGKQAFLSLILDMDKLEFANATSKTSTDIFLNFTHLFQDNYPERLKSAYGINAPAYYVFIYTIIKAVMSNAMIRKINIFSYSGWKEKLAEIIDADILPAFLGGKRTDPDGNTHCKSFITLPGKIPEKYYLSKEERYFKDPTKVSYLVIRPSEKKEIFVHVKEAGLVMRWKFLVRDKTIWFGLRFEESQGIIKDIIPMHEYDTSDGTEENSYKCFSKGKYIIIFDNSNSIFTTKEIQYIVSAEKSEI